MTIHPAALYVAGLVVALAFDLVISQLFAFVRVARAARR